MQPQIDKRRVANSFSKAANTYDSAASLQRDVGYELLAWLNKENLAQAKVLDLGCGTGYFSEKILKRHSNVEIIGLDIAQGMLKHAKQHRGQADMQWLCADAEQLPLSASSIDVVFSSLAIQWCENVPQMFSEVQRVLKPNGSALIASLGPHSLFELKKSWAAVDEKVHVNRFVSMNSIIDQLPIGLQVQAKHRQTRVLEYNKLQELTADLKKIGAHNMNSGEIKGLTGRAKIKKFKQNYEIYRQQNGTLPASYDVYYLQLRKKFS
jgi:malonyl-CoA O-methyltransferase